MMRSELESGVGLARLDAEAAEREAAEAAAVERIFEQFPDLREKWAPKTLPERDQAHRAEPLIHNDVPDAGRSGRHSEVRLPPQAPPPMLMPEGRLSTTDQRGFLASPAPRRTVWPVEQSGAPTSPTDARFKALEREVASLRAVIKQGAGSMAAPVVAAAKAAAEQPVGMTPEQMREQWRADAYQAAKRSRANEDGSGWSRIGGY